MHGPVAEVDKAKEVIGGVIREITSKIMVEEIKVESNIIALLLAKMESILNTFAKNWSSDSYPSEALKSWLPIDVIRIEGSPQSVVKAKQELETIIKKWLKRRNEVSKDLFIEQRFHATNHRNQR